MSKRVEHASRYLRGNQAIAALLSGIQRNAELLREIRRCLPDNLAEQCLHASIEGDTLVLVTGSPVWASRLRFLARQLLHASSRCGGGASRCRVRVQPSSIPPADTRSGHCQLSARTVAHLLEAAQSARDEDVAAAFRRLAEIGGERD